MSQSAAAPSMHQEERFSFEGATHGKVGMWIFLLTDGMSFAGLLLNYGIQRSGSHSWPDPTRNLGINFTALMTFVLICSSVTMVMALAGAQERNKKALCRYLGLTILGGLFFLCGQVYEYTHLIHEQHMTLSGSIFQGGDIRFPGTFYTVTGFHGLHVLTGVIYLSVILLFALRGKYTDGPRPPASHVEVVGLFWHFVDLVWILVFTFIYLI
jgi:cytochrome c oxidase subunit 3